MKHKRTAIFTICLTATLLLSACGGADVPSMSDAEYDRVVNYAAGLLVRYSKGTPERLTYLDPTYTPEYLAATEPPAIEEPVATPEPEPEIEEPKNEEPPEIEDTEPDDEPEDEPFDEPEDNGDEDETDYNKNTGDDEGVSVSLDSSMLQALADGIHVEYTGYSVRNSYPDTEAQGAVSAAYGDKLLIVDFHLKNQTDEAVTLNTARYGPSYKLVINDNVQGFTLVTMIENDLSSLYTDIAPGGWIDAVLLMEVPEDLAKSVDRLDLKIIQGGETQTIRLE